MNFCVSYSDVSFCGLGGDDLLQVCLPPSSPLAIGSVFFGEGGRGVSLVRGKDLPSPPPCLPSPNPNSSAAYSLPLRPPSPQCCVSPCLRSGCHLLMVISDVLAKCDVTDFASAVFIDDVDAGAGRVRSTGRVNRKLVEVHRSSGVLLRVSRFTFLAGLRGGLHYT